MTRLLLIALAFSALAAGPRATSQPADPPAKARIVLVWTPPDHPYGTHMYELECRLLAKCLNQTRGVEAVVSPDPEWPKDESILDGARAVVFYSRYAGDIVLSPAHKERFKKLLDSRAGFAAIHWATKAQDPALLDDYINILGGAFHEQPGWGLKTDTRPLIQPDPDHPICRGWRPLDLREEWYLGTRLHKEAHPVISVKIDDRDQVLAWTFDRPDGGRSFGATLGHFHDNFTQEPFRRALVNGILWSARLEIPKDGAPVALADDDLKLPPEPAPKK